MFSITSVAATGRDKKTVRSPPEISSDRRKVSSKSPPRITPMTSGAMGNFSKFIEIGHGADAQHQVKIVDPAAHAERPDRRQHHDDGQEHHARQAKDADEDRAVKSPMMNIVSDAMTMIATTRRMIAGSMVGPGITLLILKAPISAASRGRAGDAQHEERDQGACDAGVVGGLGTEQPVQRPLAEPVPFTAHGFSDTVADPAATSSPTPGKAPTPVPITPERVIVGR